MTDHIALSSALQAEAPITALIGTMGFGATKDEAKSGLSEKGRDYLPDIISFLVSALTSSEGLATLEETIRHLRDENFIERASALRHYAGLDSEILLAERLRQIAERLVKQAPDIAALSFVALSAVFTAHPTFALDNDIYDLLARKAENPDLPVPSVKTHRRKAPPTLAEEQALALDAIRRGRDALDSLNREIFRAACKRWPDEAGSLNPAPITLASWVGFDTDGRNDIGWWDTIRIRLELKIAQLERLQQSLAEFLPSSSPLGERVAQALTATKEQHRFCPVVSAGQQPSPDLVADFARRLIALREDSLLDATELMPLFAEARASLPIKDSGAEQLDVIRAGFLGHGLGIAHIHTRLNAAQIYNVARSRLELTDDPTQPSHRQVLLSHIEKAMDDLNPLEVDFGGLLIEPSAAARLMMTMAQILKHIDTKTPIRFLIAETESGYTLLATLWLARLFGIQDHQIDISPLFETQNALENGETILEEAFRSAHWRKYLRANGRLSLQFGYSDSGRYIGQLAAGPLVERLRLRVLKLMKDYGLENVALTIFDTHGESIGRGAHPFSLRERLRYFSPAHTRHALHKAGIPCRFETAFQGGDGYCLFGAEKIATSTIATLAEYLAEQHDEAAAPPHDPLYDNSDFAADFFSTIAMQMNDLVDDPGYTALLSAFGPALIDKTGSRPSARQSDTANITRITHPGQIRAIPNNAILQQLGWWANILHGLGEAASRHPETFTYLRQRSPRFQLLMDFATQALAHSDLDVLRSTLTHLDPGTWLDRASHSTGEDLRNSFMAVAYGLEDLEFWKTVPAMFRRIQRDHIALQTVWPDAPVMAEKEKLVHAIRFALMMYIWQLATRIPYFGPRGTVTREAITKLLLCLDVPRALHLLHDLFPVTAPDIANLDFGEPGSAAVAQGFSREHREIFVPLERAFNLLREAGIAIMHSNHNFG